MELPRRVAADVYLPDGSLRLVIEKLRSYRGAHDLRIAIVYPFDSRTRMLPYWYADTRVAPCSVRTIADCLSDAGFRHIRIILQQWTPNFRPSRAILDGRPLDMLLVSAMQVHAERAFELIRDTHESAGSRPLILAGGPKAIYEPTDFLELGPRPGTGADCIVTGEVFVLLQLLDTVLGQLRGDETVLEAYRRARSEGLLETVPGLVYPDAASAPGHPLAINTGVQRLVRDLDEYPMPDQGYRLIERPHRRATLGSTPVPAARIGRKSTIATMLATQGCKFSCSYCPIPGVNQRTWRHKSAGRFAAEIRHIHETFGIREFFGTDDNFFNNRQTVIDAMTALSLTRSHGVPIGERISFYTEATEFDVHRNRDLLPLCRRAGLRAIWFGIEDITATLVNKGQTADKTADLFRTLSDNDILPMALTIHSDEQPLQSAPGTLAGLLNQARHLFRLGAVSYQCTYLGPAVGTRDFEPAARDGIMYKAVGGQPVPQAFQDGNHVAASRHGKPWWRQINILLAYASFYNPLNTVRVLLGRDRPSIRNRRLLFQAIGQLGLLITAPKLLRWALKLKLGPIESWSGLQPARIPMIAAGTGGQINWAIEHLPTPGLPDHIPRLGAGSPQPARHSTWPSVEPRSPVVSRPGITIGIPLTILHQPALNRGGPG
jgi:radical SAM superfamily enzyme YgiQ (UPF0313 family)